MAVFFSIDGFNCFSSLSERLGGQPISNIVYTKTIIIIILFGGTFFNVTKICFAVAIFHSITWLSFLAGTPVVSADFGFTDIDPLTTDKYLIPTIPFTILN